jgi:hypothetical protein
MTKQDSQSPEASRSSSAGESGQPDTHKSSSGTVALHSSDIGAARTGAPDGAAVAVDDEDRLPTFREVVDLIVHPLVLRSFAVMVAITIVLVALRVVTWNEIADGARSRYLKTALFGGASALMVWFLVLLQTGARSRLPIWCAAAVLVTGDAVHYVRLANPITWGGSIVSFDGTFAENTPLESRWEVETSGGGTTKVEGTTAVLTAGPSQTAYLLAKIDKEADIREKWWLPLGLATLERSETLKWRATIDRTGGYYVLLEIRNLLVQAVPYGLHVTYPDANKKVTGNEIQTTVTLDGKPHDWEITRDPKEIRIRVDGQELWKAAQQGPLEQLKLGESKRDAAHGGVLRVERASYRRDIWRGAA